MREITNICFRVELKKRNSQIILLNTASNVYKTETQTAIKNLENLKEELNQVIICLNC